MKLANENAEKILRMYEKKVLYIIRPLSKKDMLDIKMEIDSHIYESMARYPKGDEVSTLIYALEKLGDPEDFLPQVVAERKLAQAGRSFNPAHIASAIALNIGRGFIKSVMFIIIGLFYLLSFGFAALSIIKLFAPANVGFFINTERSIFDIGWINNIAPGTKEILGAWFTPVILAAAILIYILNTILLKYIPKKRKSKQ